MIKNIDGISKLINLPNNSLYVCDGAVIEKRTKTISKGKNYRF